MSTEAFESIKRGLEEAIAHAQGEPVDAVLHKPLTLIDVEQVRARVGMTQAQFAVAFGIPMDTLQHWEQGKHSPEGPALALLRVAYQEPQAVLRVLSA